MTYEYTRLYKIGDTLRITSGNLKGFAGTVTRLIGRDGVEIESKVPVGKYRARIVIVTDGENLVKCRVRK